MEHNPEVKYCFIIYLIKNDKGQKVFFSEGMKSFKIKNNIDEEVEYFRQEEEFLKERSPLIKFAKNNGLRWKQHIKIFDFDNLYKVYR